jgi:hypothetical protein
MTLEEQIHKMYDSSLASQKETLAQDYQKADSALTAEKQQAQKTTDVNLTRTAVEAQKAAVNNAELHNAYGLSSGAMAQARLSQENQLQADLTALRAQQQAADADVERRRSLLGQEYASAIRQAQAENDMARAQALYDRASVEDERLNQQKLLAEERAYNERMLSKKAEADKDAGPSAWEIAKFMAEEAGDYTLVGQMLGYSQAQIDGLNGVKGDIAATLDPLVGIINDGTVKPEQSGLTDRFVKNLPSWEEIQRTTPGYKNMDDYISEYIVTAWEKGQLSDGEAKWLINRYGVWTYVEDKLK